MGQTQGIWSLHLQQADHLREAMPLKIGISCAIISISRWIPALKRSPLWVKTLKRKECGKGIRQRKDGLYSARYYTKDGERREKYFKSLPEAKQKNPTTTGYMLCCWKPGCARVTDWFDWGRHPLGEAYSYRHKWGGNPKIGQHKITIIKENFGIWN